MVLWFLRLWNARRREWAFTNVDECNIGTMIYTALILQRDARRFYTAV